MERINSRLTEREAKARRDALDIIKGNINTGGYDSLKPFNI